MPPPTPRTMLDGTSSPSPAAGRAVSRWVRPSPGAGEQSLADLTQRDGQRLLLDPGLDQRADVLQQALAELGVVGVDLPRPLGRHDDQAVLAVYDLEQVVDGRVGDALRGGITPLCAFRLREKNHGATKAIVKATSWRQTSLTDVLISVRSNSSSAASSTRAAASLRCDDVRGLRAAAGEPADQFFPVRRGEKNQQGIRHRTAHLPRARKIDFQKRGNSGRQFLGQRAARRSIPVAGECRPFEQIPAGQHPVELGITDKVILPAIDFTGPRCPCGHRYREPDFRAFLPQPGYHGALADPGRAGKNG